MNEAQPPTEPEGIFEGLRAVPILLGALLDHFATLLATGLVVSRVAPDVMEGPLTQEAADQLGASLPFLLGTLISGALCTVLGAFVGARMAGRLHVRHGGWVAVVATVLSLVYLIPPSDPYAASQPQIPLPLWVEVVSWLAILPAGVAGGLLARALQPGTD